MGDVVGYYFEWLLLEKMTRREHTMRKNGEAFMQMTPETFMNWRLVSGDREGKRGEGASSVDSVRAVWCDTVQK